MTTYTEVRAALQLHAATASGFPAANQIAYEGVTFTSTVGTPWARMTLLPVDDGPFSVSGAIRYAHGLFQVDVYSPSRGSPGTLAVEQMADNVISVFKSGTHLFQGSTEIIIDKANRGPLMISEDFLSIPTTISWRSYPAA